MSKLQDARKQYSIDGTSANAYKLICELEKANTEMRGALEFYMEHKNDSRNMGIITTVIKKVLDNE